MMCALNMLFLLVSLSYERNLAREPYETFCLSGQRNYRLSREFWAGYSLQCFQQVRALLS